MLKILVKTVGRLCPPFWSHTNLNLGRVGAKLRHLGTKLGHLGTKLGRSWGLSGRIWPQVGPMLRPCWIETAHLVLGRSAKCANYRSPVHFLPACPRRNAPPFNAVPVWQICPHHSPLNYHVSEPSARADSFRVSTIYNITYIHACKHACMHTHTYARMHACIHTHMHTYIHT